MIPCEPELVAIPRIAIARDPLGLGDLLRAGSSSPSSFHSSNMLCCFTKSFGVGPEVTMDLVNMACHPLYHVLVKGALLLLRLLHWHVRGDAIPACLPVTNACVTTRALDGQIFRTQLL